MKNAKSLRDYLKNKKKESGGFVQDLSVYPHWKLNFNASSVTRMLPDGNPKNPTFWAEKKMIPMTFIGPDGNKVYFQAPCREMYEQGRCPVLEPVRALYKEVKALEGAGNSTEAAIKKKIAGKHWLDASTAYNALILKSGFLEENRPSDAPKIRRLVFTKQIQTKVETSLGLSDDDNLPSLFKDDELPCGTFDMNDVNMVMNGEVTETEIEQVLARFNGYNFLIKKTQQGDYANYTESQFLMNQLVSLDEEQLNIIHTEGLPDLSKWLPARPTDEQYKIMVEMVKVSIASGEWNPEWEEVGLKFYTKTEKDGDAAAASAGSVADKVQANVASAKAGTGVSGLASVLAKRRAATPAEGVKPVVVEETASVEEETATETTPEPVTAPVKPVVAAKRDPKTLAASIKKALAEKTAATS